MPDQEADLFPALLAAALFAHRSGKKLPSSTLGGLISPPSRPLDFAHEDLPELDLDDNTPALSPATPPSPITPMGLAA